MDTFSKNIQITNLIKTRPVEAELFHADRQTDMTKLAAAYRNFEETFNKRNPFESDNKE
jgi:hypothetical protein